MTDGSSERASAGIRPISDLLIEVPEHKNGYLTLSEYLTAEKIEELEQSKRRIETLGWSEADGILALEAKEVLFKVASKPSYEPIVDYPSCGSPPRSDLSATRILVRLVLGAASRRTPADTVPLIPVIVNVAKLIGRNGLIIDELVSLTVGLILNRHLATEMAIDTSGELCEAVKSLKPSMIEVATVNDVMWREFAIGIAFLRNADRFGGRDRLDQLIASDSVGKYGRLEDLAVPTSAPAHASLDYNIQVYEHLLKCGDERLTSRSLMRIFDPLKEIKAPSRKDAKELEEIKTHLAALYEQYHTVINLYRASAWSAQWYLHRLKTGRAAKRWDEVGPLPIDSYRNAPMRFELKDGRPFFIFNPIKLSSRPKAGWRLHVFSILAKHQWLKFKARLNHRK